MMKITVNETFLFETNNCMVALEKSHDFSLEN